MTTFSEINIRPDIIKGLEELGFTSPTPIQEKVIPLILEKQQDVVSLAQTGTGKTAAFGIPLIQLTEVSNRQTQALVLCPTRELCIQVGRDLSEIAKYVPGLKNLAVYGGASIEPQIRALRQGVHIIVATPGRLLDLIRRGAVDISAIRSVVLDEADEMLNMGFQEELNAILGSTPASKNTLLFSATMPKEVTTIARKYMRQPLEITIGKRNAGAENVQHVYYMVRAKDRYLALKRIIDNNPEIYGIIFCRTRLETSDVAEKLVQDGYTADALHGELSQGQRDLIMNKFRRQDVQILVATDVAARGLDVKDLTHIINYNLPDDSANYTHRSGRTGRAGKTGVSISIIHMREKHRIKELELKMTKKFDHLPVPSGQEICELQLLRQLDAVLNLEVDHARIDPMLPTIMAKFADLTRDELIKRFVAMELNPFLEYYKDAPDLNETERKPTSPYQSNREFGSREFGRSSSRENGRGFASGSSVELTRFALNVGKKDGVHAGRFIGLINESSRTRKITIGKISISENNSFLEADSQFTDSILGAFKDLMINGKNVKVEVSSNQAPSGAEKSRKPYKSGAYANGAEAKKKKKTGYPKS